jgi:hypothetical protein
MSSEESSSEESSSEAVANQKNIYGSYKLIRKL